MSDLLLVAVGLATLLGGADLLLRGATRVAESFGMSRLLIGLTIVSLGTSAPELAICLDAAMKGTPEIALGNIVGSNIANILLILGLTAIFIPIVIHQEIIQREIPIMIGVAILFLALVSDGILGRLDGLLLFGSMILFLGFQFIKARRANTNSPQTNEAADDSGRSVWIDWVLIGLGIAMLWIGAGWMVHGATNLAASLGVSQLVIGLTVVAIGSSSPEIATSLLAARQGNPEMAVGSVIGSNISNLLLVGGMTALLSRNITVPLASLDFDIPVMIVASIACVPIMISGQKIDRFEGGVFLVCFTMFNLCLFFKDSLSSIFPGWRQMVWPIAVPLIIATVGVIVFRQLKPTTKTD